MTTDTLEGFLSGGGAPAAKFAEHGATVKGTVVSAELKQQTDPADGSVKTWQDGSPRMQVVVTLSTDERDPAIDDDDGTRRVFMKGNMLKALKDALRQAGSKTIEPGGQIAIRYTGDGEKTNPAYSAPKLYAAQYKAPEPQASAVSVDELL